MVDSTRQSTEEIRQEKAIRNVVFGMTFLCCLVLNIILLVKHQPYRDEVNVWLFAKYASPVKLLQEIHTQGHPFLWYFLVMPFAKIGISYRFIEILSFFIMMAAALLVLCKSKLLGIGKICCLISPIFIYFYPVIARNYCLIALFMMLLAIVYPDRNKKPILYGLFIGLLIQADTVALGIAFGFCLAWFLENLWKGFFHIRWTDFRRMWKGIWIPAVSCVLWLLQMWKEILHSDHVVEIPGKEEIWNQFKGYSFYIMERMTGWKAGFICVFFVLVLIAALAISACNMRFGAVIVMLCGYGFQVAFSILCYQLHIWHFIALTYVFIWMIWVLQLDTMKCQEKEKRDGREKLLKNQIRFGARIALNLLLAVLAIGMFGHWNSDGEYSNMKQAFGGVYSNGVEAAKFVQEKIPSDGIIISTNITMENPILAKIDDQYTFYHPLTGDALTYTKYTKEETPDITLDEVKTMVKNKWSTETVFYIIFTADSMNPAHAQMQEEWLIYESKVASVKGEDYQIYCVPLQ